MSGCIAPLATGISGLFKYSNIRNAFLAGNIAGQISAFGNDREQLDIGMG